MIYLQRVKRNGKIDLFVLCEFVLCFIIVLSTLLIRINIASTAFTVSFLALVVAAFFKSTSKEKVDFLGLTISIIVFSFLCVIASTIMLGESFTFEYLKEYFIFVSTVLLMLIWSDTSANASTVNFLLKFNILIALLYPIAYKSFPQINQFNSLSLNFSNPNLTGMWILQSVLYSILGFLLLKKWIWRLLCVFAAIYNIYLMNLTEARNCIIALTLFVGLIIWLNIKRICKMPKWIIFIINIIPICFIPLYLNLIYKIMDKGWLSFFESEGKSLTSRVNIWNERFDLIKGYWLTGAYPTAGGNAHNSHLTVLASYGVIVLLLVIAFTYLISVKLNNNCSSKKQAYALAAFFSALFMGFGEGALFSGGQGIYIMVCGFLLLANAEYPDDIFKINKLTEGTDDKVGL